MISTKPNYSYFCEGVHFINYEHLATKAGSFVFKIAR